MCRPVRCKQCKKTTWAGCGNHVQQVKATVPKGDWCTGHDGDAPSSAPRGGLLNRILGR